MKAICFSKQCPTTIVPVFSDQPFWGERVHASGVGPAPIPVDEFNRTKLVEAINFMLDSKVRDRAVEEDWVMGAVKAFFKHLPRPKPEPQPVAVPPGLFSFTSAAREFSKVMIVLVNTKCPSPFIYIVKALLFLGLGNGKI
ncbi:hypothetical protein MLD38_031715 [Melastoma candidum]|uniref:Uncharacterized protein n=1 Tax=Melastoma candidum TaxID=119954 RepID=A0ACB9MSJ4_9MYRT|nr:hypothetical protein MLD38_031715 [Melastoma candidum]